MPGYILLFTTREQLALPHVELLPFELPPSPGEPVLPPENPPAPVVFPWVTVNFRGRYFDQLRVETKDAISWFFTPEDWEAAASITLCESPAQDPFAHNPRGEDSHGIWQINMRAHSAAITVEQAQNIWTATEYAARLYYAHFPRWIDWCNCAVSRGLLPPGSCG